MATLEDRIRRMKQYFPAGSTMYTLSRGEEYVWIFRLVPYNGLGIPYSIEDVTEYTSWMLKDYLKDVSVNFEHERGIHIPAGEISLYDGIENYVHYQVSEALHGVGPSPLLYHMRI